MSVDADDGPTHGGQKRIADAVDRVIESVEQYTRAAQYDGQYKHAARQELHSAVIALYYRMEPYLAKDKTAWHDLRDCEFVERDVLWHGHHPRLGHTVTIDGFADLREWAERTEVLTSQSNGSLSRNGSGERYVTVCLPGDAALECAWLLRRYFDEFGWDVEIRHGTPEDEPEGGDLVELLAQRGQTEAIDQLPDRFVEDYMEGRTNGK